jgi:hypothetical protein
MKIFEIIQKNRTYVLIFCASLALGASKPVDGDFVNRSAQVWSKDLIGSSLVGYNQMLCVLTQLKPQENVDGDPYRARVNYSACEPGKTASPSDTFYIYTVRVFSEASGYSAHIWNTASEKDGRVTNLANVGYYKVFVSTAVQGDFRLEFCSATSASGGECVFKAYLTKENTRINVHANSGEDLSNNTIGFYYHLVAEIDGDNGFGSVKNSGIEVNTSSPSGKFQYDYDINYAFRANRAALSIIRYQMGDIAQPLFDVIPSGNKCINLSKSAAKKTVFSYEVFNSDGSRYLINKGQIPYTIVNADGQVLTDANGDRIHGRIMWGDNNQEGWFLSVNKSVIINRLQNGEQLRVFTTFGGLPNTSMKMELNPGNGNDFQILEKDGTPYRMSGALSLRFTIKNGESVEYLLDSSLEGTTLTLSYMGNEYIHGIPWNRNSGPGFNIKEGASATDATGKIYFIRPMFYSVEPIDEVCSTEVVGDLNRTTVTRALLPQNPTYGGEVSPNWRDPRLIIGPVPTINSSFKYIDGEIQN